MKDLRPDFFLFFFSQQKCGQIQHGGRKRDSVIKQVQTEKLNKMLDDRGITRNDSITMDSTSKDKIFFQCPSLRVQGF